MSEEETMPMDSAESMDETNTEVPQAPALGVNDLKLMANVLEVVSNRGAIRANEMAAVGGLYNLLVNFLVANGAVEVNEPEVSEDAEVGEDTEEEISTEEVSTEE